MPTRMRMCGTLVRIEVSGRAEVSDQGIEPFDVRVALEDALELSEEGLVGLVSEKASVHRAQASLRRGVGSGLRESFVGQIIELLESRGHNRGEFAPQFGGFQSI